MAWARRLGSGAEIIGCDSVQVYQGFDVGSAKASMADRQEVPHHLVDVVSWREKFDADRYGSLARSAILDVLRRGRVPLVVGGSGMYLRALWQDQWQSEDHGSDEAFRASLRDISTEELFVRLMARDAVRARSVHKNDRFRIVRALEIVECLGFASFDEYVATSKQDGFPRGEVLRVELERSQLHRRIERRTEAMLADERWIEEVRQHLADGCPRSSPALQSVGYRQVVEALDAPRWCRDDLVASVKAATRQCAKRQIAWFKRLQARVITPGSVLAALVPMDLAVWRHVSFDRIAPNLLEVATVDGPPGESKSDAIRFRVERSASFLLYVPGREGNADVASVMVDGLEVVWRTDDQERAATDAERDREKKSREADDFPLRVGLLRRGERPLGLFGFFVPRWVRQVQEYVKGTVDQLFYWVGGARNSQGTEWVSPWDSHVRYRSLGPAGSNHAWQVSRDLLDEPIEALGIVLMADGDQEGRSFVTDIRELKIREPVDGATKISR